MSRVRRLRPDLALGMQGTVLYVGSHQVLVRWDAEMTGAGRRHPFGHERWVMIVDVTQQTS